MNMTLTRLDFLSSGIFGELDADDGSLSLKSLEHAYPVDPDGLQSSTHYAPKIPVGAYLCVRGTHRLEGMTHDFETFEITGVEGHSNLLFHVGNINKDSSGCVLLGLDRDGNSSILHSRNAFKLFMDAQQGVDSFILTVL